MKIIQFYFIGKEYIENIIGFTIIFRNSGTQGETLKISSRKYLSKVTLKVFES